MHYFCPRYSHLTQKELRKSGNDTKYTFCISIACSAGVSVFARVDSSTTVRHVSIFTHCLHPDELKLNNVWDAHSRVRNALCPECLSITLLWWWWCLPCASPPLVRTAMAFPAPLIRSFSKSTCMMEDHQYKSVTEEKHSHWFPVQSFWHSPHVAHELCRRRARTRAWLRLLFVLRALASSYTFLLVFELSPQLDEY